MKDEYDFSTGWRGRFFRKGARPVDAAAWRARLEEYQHIPFMEDGRDQGTIVDDDDDVATFA